MSVFTHSPITITYKEKLEGGIAAHQGFYASLKDMTTLPTYKIVVANNHYLYYKNQNFNIIEELVEDVQHRNPAKGMVILEMFHQLKKGDTFVINDITYTHRSLHVDFDKEVVYVIVEDYNRERAEEL